MKKIFLLIYVVIFFMVCSLPGAAMLAGVKTANLENRQLAELPAFAPQGELNLDFPTEFNSFMSDNFGLRQYYVTAWTALDYYLLGTSANDSVIAGRDGWLFFGDEAHDYLGAGLLSSSDISRIVRTLQIENEYLESRGVAFVFTVAPNKSTIYGEYMPARYVKETTDSNLNHLASALKGSGVVYSDLDAALTAQKNTAQLYLKKDSHWNNIGALIGYRTLMGSVSNALGGGFQFDSYSDATYTWKRDWSGDLETMLLPALGNLDWQAAYNIPQAFRYSGKPRTMEDMRIAATSGASGTRLLMFRDSFANALIPVMSNAFGYACYARNFPYDLTMLDSERPNVVVEEIVERNIPTLLQAAPVMPAPRADISPDGALKGGTATAEAGPENSGLVEISGWAPAGGADASADPAIYIELSNGSGNSIFEPFPIGGGDAPKGMENALGFTMYLDESALDKGSYTVNVLVKNGDGLEIEPTNLNITIN